MFVGHHRDIVETIKVGQALVRRKRRGEERRGEERRGEERRGEERTEVKGEREEERMG